MSHPIITELTADQKAQIRTYRDKWKQIALSTEPINQEEAKKAIKRAYWLISTANSASTFCRNPDVDSDLNILLIKAWDCLRNSLIKQIKGQLSSSVLYSLIQDLYQPLKEELRQPLSQIFGVWLGSWTGRSSPLYLSFCLGPEAWACEGLFIDYCISVLNCVPDPQKWEVFQELTHHCGWIIPSDQGLRVCDRAYQLRVDAANRPHAEGEPALEFKDGFGLYAYHGIPLPERYGKVHPEQWQAAWILEETNAELRRVLIDRIGYNRICQELEADELDSWKEYTLLRVKNWQFTNEAVLLLKMTCPSTRHIHALRVPPDLTTARGAIQWINHGIDPENFEAQT